MDSNQKGFSVVEILVVILLVGLIGTVGWFVYDRQQHKSSNTSQTQEITQQTEAPSEPEKAKEFSATSFSLDTSRLPKGWTAPYNTRDLITLTSGNSDGCFIEVIKKYDTTLSSAKKVIDINTLLTAIDKTSSKGYVVTEKGASTLTIFTASGAEKVNSHEFLWDISDGGSALRYSKVYSIHDGYYISVKRSCDNEAGFANADTAMPALTFSQ